MYVLDALPGALSDWPLPVLLVGVVAAGGVGWFVAAMRRQQRESDEPEPSGWQPPPPPVLLPEPPPAPRSAATPVTGGLRANAAGVQEPRLPTGGLGRVSPSTGAMRSATGGLQPAAPPADAFKAPTGALKTPTGSIQRVTAQSAEEYVLLRIIGEGVTGAVCGAIGSDGEPPPHVAVKVLKNADAQNEELWVRFSREVDVCRTLMHPAVIRVMDWGIWQGQDPSEQSPFMVMELVDGDTLRSLMDRTPGQPLDWSRSVLWLLEILEGLGVAHRAGVIQRDIKPDNLMITREGRPKIMDFGLARQANQQSGVTRTNTHLGTPIYMSPEHFNARNATSLSDLYSMGVVGYEMLAGRPP